MIENMTSSTIYIQDYSQKSFVLCGDTIKYKDTIKLMGGKWNNRLTNKKSGERFGAWLFWTDKRDEIEKWIGEGCPNMLNQDCKNNSEDQVNNKNDINNRLSSLEYKLDMIIKHFNIKDKHSDIKDTLTYNSIDIDDISSIVDDTHVYQKRKRLLP